MRVLSLYDGMSCGQIAFRELGIPVESYDAYEIDKYAIKVSEHNFPEMHSHGDVMVEDYHKYQGYDWLVGGSPCTYWSIAQSPDKRETTSSGIGWELFSHYVRALHEAKPRFFLYENNKSMSKDIRKAITETFGFEPYEINSALVSAQNRQRLYWVGVLQPDGTYARAKIPMPDDRGILLKDVLDDAVALKEKANCLCGSRGGMSIRHDLKESRTNLIAEPVELSEREMDYMVRDSKRKYSDRFSYLAKPGEKDKSECVTANMSRGVPYNVCAEPVCVASRGRNPENPSDRTAGNYVEQRYEAHDDGKTNTLTTVSKDNMVCEPIEVSQNMFREYGSKGKILEPEEKAGTVMAAYGCGGGNIPNVAEPVGTTKDGKAFAVTAYYSTGQNAPHTLEKHLGSMVSEPIQVDEFLLPKEMRIVHYDLKETYDKESGVIGRLDMPAGNHDQSMRVYGENGKGPTVTTCGGGNLEPKVFTRIPVCLNSKDENGKQPSIEDRIYDVNGKGTAVTTGFITNVAEPVETTVDGKSYAITSSYYKASDAPMSEFGEEKRRPRVAEPVNTMDGKSKTVMASYRRHSDRDLIANDYNRESCVAYAVECDENGKPTKAVGRDGKTYTVYEVSDGQITVKEKRYPIKLRDGYYIIRKLTVSECKRLQTIPDWYDMSVISNSQAYKCLGNGWTCSCISWLLEHAMKNGAEIKEEQGRLF